MNLYRIIWRRNNGAGVPATFHVIDSVSADTADTAGQLARETHPECPAEDLAVIIDGQLNDALASAQAQADAQAAQEGWDGIARAKADQIAAERDRAEIAARAAAAEKALADRQAAALAAAQARLASLQTVTDQASPAVTDQASTPPAESQQPAGV